MIAPNQYIDNFWHHYTNSCLCVIMCTVLQTYYQTVLSHRYLKFKQPSYLFSCRQCNMLYIDTSSPSCGAYLQIRHILTTISFHLVSCSTQFMFVILMLILLSALRRLLWEIHLTR